MRIFQNRGSLSGCAQRKDSIVEGILALAPQIEEALRCPHAAAGHVELLKPFSGPCLARLSWCQSAVLADRLYNLLFSGH